MYNPTIINISRPKKSVADSLSRPPEITSIYLRRYETDSDYEEISDSESENEVSDNQSYNTDEHMVRSDKLDRELIRKCQKIEPDLIEEAK